MSAMTTALCTTQKNPEAFRLTVDSFRRHNPGIPVWCWENEADGETRAFAAQNCERVFHKTGPLGHHHAEPLDRMIKEVKTPFVLTLDDDVMSHAPAVEQMIREMEAVGDLAFAASLPASENMGSVLHHEKVMLYGQPRIDPCFALFRTALVARMTTRVSFAPYECCNLGKFYDTGGMLRQAAEGAGYRVLELPWLKTKVTHWGALTWAGYASEDSPTFRNYSHRIGKMREAAKVFYGDMATRQTKEFVVARYKEDFSWTKDAPGKVTVYDKSDSPIPGTIALPNYGREANTYAEHVARNYDALADVVVFTQGKPFDHCPTFLKDVQEPVTRFRPYGPHTFDSFADGDPGHRGLPSAKFFRELTRRCMPEVIQFNPGALFAATRETLHRYPKAWWRALADRLAAPDTQGWAPWTIERLWRQLLIGEPMPHCYETARGWFDYQDLYAQAVKDAPYDAHFVEVGVFHGRSLLHLGVEAINSGKNIKITAVDNFRGSEDPDEKFMRDEADALGGSFRSVFETNIAPIRHVVDILQMDSVAAADTFADESLDLVFIDAGHTEEAVAADIRAWRSKIKPGALLCGHDYNKVWPGVIAAVDKAFGSEVLRLSSQCWGYRKPE